MGIWLKIRKIVSVVLIAYLIFLLVSGAFPPLQRKQVSKEYQSQSALRLDSPRTGTGERIRSIEDNRDALIWRLRMIEAAQERIVLSTFDFDSDNSGWDIMSAILHAAQRGVKVQIIMDGINGFLSWHSGPPMRALASQPNVEFKLYNPINLLTPWKLNYRLHDKYLMIDDFMYVLGGRNTNDLFLGDYIEHPNFDRDILVWRPDTAVEGSQDDLQDYFESVWALPGNQLKRRPGKKSDRLAEELAEHYKTLPEKYPEAFEQVDWAGETTEVRSIQLWNNPIRERIKEPELWHTLRASLMQGSDIVMQTPYIVCGRDMYEDLDRLAADGRRMQIITNAVANGANPFGCTDYLNNKEKIRKTGSEIYELYSNISSHTKTVLVDDHLSYVGSYNFDMRSTYLDTELMLGIDCPELNQELRGYAQELMSHSNHVLPDGTEQPGENCQVQELGLFKQILYGVMRLLTLPIRHLL